MIIDIELMRYLSAKKEKIRKLIREDIETTISVYLSFKSNFFSAFLHEATFKLPSRMGTFR